MTKYINFEDNIFILNARLRIIQDLLNLDTDPELFLEKTLDDIHFIDAALESLLGYLKGNQRLIERENQFDNLFDIEWKFSQVLTEFLNNKGNFSTARFPALRDKILLLRTRSQDRRQNIDELGGGRDELSVEPVVSSEELNELLKNFE
jgi:hypothetical protein